MQNLEQLYDTYVDRVYKYFYVQCLDRHLAEDLTSQTFIAFIDSTKKRQIDEQKKYLYAVMRHVWADYLRAKYKNAVSTIEAIDDFESHADTTVATFETMSLVERAAVYIDRLPEKQRQVAELRFVQGRSLKDIAAELGRTMSYVKTTQNRAIKGIKAMLDEPELGGVHR